MNKKELNHRERQNHEMYHVPGCSHTEKRKKNAIFISPGNGLPHEIEKLKICYELQETGSKYITEAVSNETNLRHDIVDLSSGMIFEVETDPKRAERFKDMKGVIVRRLWKNDKTQRQI